MTVVDNNTPAPAPSDSSTTSPSRRDGGYRDTIESILIAFILAFIFRAFVVEAFVIPTGSMAPTLLGAHARFTCDDCGYQFEANYSTPTPDDQSVPPVAPHDQFPTPPYPGQKSVQPINCPNCAHTIHDPRSTVKTSGVPIHYGDRILVLKYAYLLNEPQRWDVVVFKSPDDPDSSDRDPDPESPNDVGKSWYTTNFIKRLVGKPGESLLILDGDVYVSQPGSDTFKVQGKPRHVQDALWRIVCDADFMPRHQKWEPWRVESGGGWDVGTPDAPRRVYRFDGAAALGAIAFDADLNNGRAFTDFLAYAQAESGRNNVSDVKLSFLYERKSGDGPLRLRLTKLDDTFTAELTPGAAKLYRKQGKPAGDDDLGGEIASAGGVSSLGMNAPIGVEFTNVDYHVTLRVGDVEVLKANYDPDIAGLKRDYEEGVHHPKPGVRIVASNQTCELSHVGVWRDVYYTNGPRQAILWGRPDDPIRLGADEYFVLGDNTVISKDARYWTNPIDLPAEDLNVQAGRVPGRFMLGKAFFVYWPAGYRPLGSDNLPGVVPNFGDMRFIH